MASLDISRAFKILRKVLLAATLALARVVIGTIQCALSLTDRTAAFEAAYGGSIPSGRTTKNHSTGGFSF